MNVFPQINDWNEVLSIAGAQLTGSRSPVIRALQREPEPDDFRSGRPEI
ncbi:MULTISPECIES: hypothetical protein [unclassified Mesorhizobium]|nr:MULTISPECIES: hypothetical protein [unclassified Mesorhizobium]MBZ9765681.1 hypothetical protein [Mesorhizobium sp. CA6]MBZ9845479.1 hypothetical protein [Mesorhizobium sp. CA5]